MATSHGDGMRIGGAGPEGRGGRGAEGRAPGRGVRSGDEGVSWGGSMRGTVERVFDGGGQGRTGVRSGGRVERVFDRGTPPTYPQIITPYPRVIEKRSNFLVPPPPSGGARVIF